MNTQYFAEFDTDKVIRNRYFNDFSYKGTIVEVGGATPDYISMSRHFKLNGWRALIVEPIPEFAQKHREFGNEVYEYAASSVNKDDVVFNKINWVNQVENPITFESFSGLSISATHLQKEGYTNGLSDMLNHNHPNNIRSNRKPILTEIKVKVRRLTDIFSEANINTIDILSIDVEGHELEVINGINFELYKPKVIVIENFDRSEKYINHMKSVSYKLDCEVEYNQIYIPS